MEVTLSHSHHPPRRTSIVTNQPIREFVINNCLVLANQVSTFCMPFAKFKEHNAKRQIDG